MGKNLKIISVLSFLFIMIFPVSAGGRKELPSGQETPQNGEIVYVDGEILVNGTRAVAGDRVAGGDIIASGEDSWCEILFPEKNVFRLLGGSSLVFGNQDFVLDRGALAIVTEKLKKIAYNSDSLSVRTSSALAGVRGTVFFVKKEDENNTYICICNGKINTYDSAGKDMESAQATHHKAIRITRENGKTRRTSPPLLYHDDSLMEEVASRIGKTIEWGDKTSSY